MQAEGVPMTRQEFLLALAAPMLLPAREGPGKLLIVVAHPDDEYAVAASTYRLVRERGWTADQLIVTDGAAGYRYSSLAETVYGRSLAQDLPAVRRGEAIRAGKVLGIRHHHFLNEKDLGFATDAAKADAANWDRARVLEFLSGLLVKERYDAVFTMLPTAETHGHHRAATALAQEAVVRLPKDARPLLLGAEARGRQEAALRFQGSEAAFAFDRTAKFGYREALNYQIVANWVVAEHKSQGLFQAEVGNHELEQFWVLEGGAEADIMEKCLR